MIKLTVGGRSVLFHDRPDLLHVAITPQLNYMQSVTTVITCNTSFTPGPNIHPHLPHGLNELSESGPCGDVVEISEIMGCWTNFIQFCSFYY